MNKLMFHPQFTSFNRPTSMMSGFTLRPNFPAQKRKEARYIRQGTAAQGQ